MIVSLPGNAAFVASPLSHPTTTVCLSHGLHLTSIKQASAMLAGSYLDCLPENQSVTGLSLEGAVAEDRPKTARIHQALSNQEKAQ
jgi:hypothetical protein